MLKQINLFFTEDNKFFMYVLAIIGVYIAQLLYKMATIYNTPEFSWKKFVDGNIKYIFYFAGTIVFFFAGCLVPNENMIKFDGKEYSITSLLALFALLLLTAQSAKMFKNIKDTFAITPEKQIEVNDKDAFIPLNEERM